MPTSRLEQTSHHLRASQWVLNVPTIGDRPRSARHSRVARSGRPSTRGATATADDPPPSAAFFHDDRSSPVETIVKSPPRVDPKTVTTPISQPAVTIRRHSPRRNTRATATSNQQPTSSKLKTINETWPSAVRSQVSSSLIVSLIEHLRLSLLEVVSSKREAVTHALPSVLQLRLRPRALESSSLVLLPLDPHLHRDPHFHRGPHQQPDQFLHLDSPTHDLIGPSRAPRLTSFDTHVSLESSTDLISPHPGQQPASDEIQVQFVVRQLVNQVCRSQQRSST